ncbi:dTDP-glucose 4,6-dehydratase [Streptomyces calidiresistens]|uniref:dTDP-glucose 4,6-dehydratase n=1 Tax=Streptomyces calidiresistens TaxID=1485586 RepID=A0A7W3T0Y7_9ACTN|nr:dTDP-glucose 4,6-dehydratase [Streptomyces calidiresistens]MBB0228895.1 dTDP-glucose 4,6-dehydratase [Streptomyces calidiresistens]
MRVLITGGAGFIGSCYARMLLDPAHPLSPIRPVERVTVLDALTYAGNRANVAAVAGDGRFAFVRGDIRDRELVRALVADHDVVAHFAAETHVDRSIASGAVFVDTNVTGTQSLLEALLRYPRVRLLHVSTDEVYGPVPEGRATEDAPLAPTSPYAASKAASDLLVLAHHRTHGLDVRVTRCSNNYGPHQYPEKIIPLFTTRLLAGRSVPLYGTGEHRRDWLHVEDHCRALHRVLEAGVPGRVYNIASGTEWSNRELTARLLAACGAGPERVRTVRDRPGHDVRYAVDTRRIRGELGWEPEWDPEEGLRLTVAWYREHRDRWAPEPLGSAR